jgi:hypothetical protein
VNDRRPGNLAHLERPIDLWSRDRIELEATAGRLRRLVAVSALAEILGGLDDGRPRLAFKGGASMEIRFGAAALQPDCVGRTVTPVDADAIQGRTYALGRPRVPPARISHQELFS